MTGEKKSLFLSSFENWEKKKRKKNFSVFFPSSLFPLFSGFVFLFSFLGEEQGFFFHQFFGRKKPQIERGFLFVLLGKKKKKLWREKKTLNKKINFYF